MRFGLGVRRPDADTHCRRRGSGRPADQQVSEGQRGDRVYRLKPGREIWLDRVSPGGTAIRTASKKQHRAILPYLSKTIA